MKCFKPYFHHFVNNVYASPLPCGSCPACRYNQSKDWSFRIELEAMEYKEDEIFFLTLTYDEVNCPQDYSLDKNAISAFMKRLRRHIPYSFRFFGCGEYGDKYQRPHYHIILFGVKEEDMMFVGVDRREWLRGHRPQSFHAWKLGFVQVERPRSSGGVAAYVARYVTKKLKASEYTTREMPYHRQSQGIGKNFLDKLPFYTPIVTYKGYTRALPKYLRRKLAEKFGVLELVVEMGKNYLDELMITIVSAFEDRRGYYHDNRKPLTYNPYPLENFAYKEYYSGLLDLQESQLKLLSVRQDL